jgi:hypothetical protein
MRYFALVLSTGVALASVPAAAAVSSDTPRDASVFAYATCPAYEGYPDCHPDGDVGSFTQPSRPRAMLAGSEHRPSHRKLIPSLAATARLRLPQ